MTWGSMCVCSRALLTHHGQTGQYADLEVKVHHLALRTVLVAGHPTVESVAVEEEEEGRLSLCIHVRITKHILIVPDRGLKRLFR